jgi:hypothetical protein
LLLSEIYEAVRGGQYWTYPGFVEG